MTRPNLVYIFADQLRYQSLGYAGDPKALTPNIDRLASTSVNFVNAIAGSAVCTMDLSHIALGQPGPEPDAAFMQICGATADWQDGHEWRALRDKRYTYAIYRVDRKELLFDHVDDPYQLTDLVDDPACASISRRLPRPARRPHGRHQRHLRNLHLVPRPLDRRQPQHHPIRHQ